MKILALDIGGTAIKAARWTDGKLTQRGEFETKAWLGGEYVLENICNILDQYGSCDRIGISTTGQVDSLKGVITYANENIPGYTGIRIGEVLSLRYQIPVAVENDVNAAALAEGVYGAAQSFENYLCLTYGTGVGGAFVINKEIYRGMSGVAGEVGSIITHGGTFGGHNGYYEEYASAKALLQRVQLQADPSIKNGKEIFENIHKPAIHRIVDEWVWEISHGLVTLIHLLNPENIVLGGGIMAQTYVIESISKVTKERVMPNFKNVRFCKAKLGNTAGIWGAVYSALQKVII